MKYLLCFDLPSKLNYFKVLLNRRLNSNAKMIQRSVWESEDLEFLKRIAELIRNAGGSAIVLKKEVVF